MKLKDGYVEIAAGNTQIQFWVDVFHPIIHVEVTNAQPLQTEVFYENWRYQERPVRKGEGQQCSYKWAPPKGTVTESDFISLDKITDSTGKAETNRTSIKRNQLLFYHRNPEQTVFDVVVAQQGMNEVKSQMMNPLKNLTFGGTLFGENLEFAGTADDVYAGTDYRAWKFRSSKAARKEHICIVLHTDQTETIEEWEQGLQTALQRIVPKGKVSSKTIIQDKKQTRSWWNSFWQRSFIEAEGEAKEITRNYTLFRYMLGCNAYASVPTKFNGGLFTFDPCHVDEKQSFTPDYRKWGGGTMTAQNQRLVYWPMLKSGDFDMMPSQFNFYNRMVKNAELGVSSLAVQVKFAFLVFVKIHSPLNQFFNLCGSFAHYFFYCATVADPVAGYHGVFDVLVEVVHGQIGHRGDASLCKIRVGLFHSGLTDEGYRPLFRHFQGEAHTGYS
mgnify:CR=1 FL=1